MTTMTLERPGTLPVTGEWNHSCSAGTCGNCGNPSGALETPDGTATGSGDLVETLTVQV